VGKAGAERRLGQGLIWWERKQGKREEGKIEAGKRDVLE
jgi:hypothetical protein